jgi:hypothetical protein
MIEGRWMRNWRGAKRPFLTYFPERGVGAKRSKIRFVSAPVYCVEIDLNDFYFLDATVM